MKHANRAPYIVLAEQAETYLCSFCKFADGGSCDDSPSCLHGLSERLPVENGDLYPGDDCWGFRPLLSISDLADCVGIALRENWKRWQWWQQKGQIYISGWREANKKKKRAAKKGKGG